MLNLYIKDEIIKEENTDFCNNVLCPFYSLYHKPTSLKQIDVFNKKEKINLSNGINKYRRIKSEISHKNIDKIDVLFIGEAPGEWEDEKGKPFVGNSGKLFRETFSSILNNYTYIITNLVNCRPLNNKMPTINSPKWRTLVEYCKPYIEEIIEKYDPKLIVTLGSHSSNAMIGNIKITKHRGRFYKVNDRYIFPIFHPSYIIRKGGIKSKEYKIWVKDMKKIYEFLNGKISPYIPDIIILKKDLFTQQDSDYYKNLILKLLYSNLYAVDIETKNMDMSKEDNEILSIAYSNGDINISIEYKGFEDIHKALLEAPTNKIFANGQFDLKYLKFLENIEVKNFKYDTMFMLYLLNYAKKDLKSNASQLLNIIAWEQDINYSNMSKMDIDTLLYYNGIDAYATYKLWEYLMKEIKEKNLEFILDLMVKSAYIVAEMETNGVKVNKEELLNIKKGLEDRLNEIYTDIMFLDGIREYKEVKRKALLYEAYKKIDKDCTIKDFKYILQNKPIIIKNLDNNLKEANSYTVNINSTQELRKILTLIYNIYIAKKTEKNQEAVDNEVLKDLASNKLPIMSIEKYKKGMIDKKKREKFSLITAFFKKDTPLLKREEAVKFAELLLLYRKLYKLYHTYIEPASKIRKKGEINSSRAWLSKDNYIYTNFNLTGTVTGRIASYNPNLQNIPRGSDIKKVFISRFKENGLILNADFKQIEFWTAFIYAQEHKLLEIYNNVYGDIHKMVASMALNKPQDQITKEERTHIKTIGFGILYGRGPISVSKSLGISVEKARELEEKFFKAMPGIKKWRDKTIAWAKKYEYITNMFGRRRPLPRINDNNEFIRKAEERKAINTPIQSSAFDTVLLGLTQLYTRFKEKKYKSKFIITVHDSIVLDIYKYEIWDIIYDMLSILNNIQFPEFVMNKYNIQVKPRIDIELGLNYKEQIKLTQFLGYDSITSLSDTNIKNHLNYLLPKEGKNKIKEWFDARGYKRLD